MQSKLYKYRLVDNKLSITNLRSYSVKSKVVLTSISYQSKIFNDYTFESNQEIIIDLNYTPFHSVDLENKMNLRVYENGVKVIDDYVSIGIEKAYILISNDKYEGITQKLIDGLERYSNIPIIHYNINYDSGIKSTNLTNIRLDFDGESDPQYMQFMKPPCFIDSIERGVQKAVFIDSDILVRPNIDSLFDIPHITEGPIIQKQRWNYVITNGMYIPGPQVSEFMGFQQENFKQPYPNGITFLVIFNHTHLELFREWKQICFSDEIQVIRKTEFLHDELLLNCLLWKHKMPPNLVTVGLNVRNEKDVNFFYQHPNLTGDFLLDMNDWGLGHFSQSHIPFDKDDILLFHCVKECDIADNINKIIYRTEVGVNDEAKFKDKLVDFYNNINSNKSIKKLKPKFSVLFHDGAFLEIKDTLKDFDVKFIDTENQKVVYNLTLQNNTWAKTSLQYFVPWKIIAENDEDRFEYDLDLAGQRVLITFESSALGDSLAWIPYVDEFRKKHNCELIVSTFLNHLFIDQYPHIKFVNPGESVHNIYAIYRIGWFYDGDYYNKNLHPNDFKSIPLQQTASDILGLEYNEVKPLVKKSKAPKKKKVGIGMQSTTQAKYWNNPSGWQEVVNYLRNLGYEVMVYSKEEDGYMDNFYPMGTTKFKGNKLEELIEDFPSCEFFIGLGSGLSWLAWACDLPVVLISGFSEKFAEMSSNCHRVINENVCHGCFNKEKLNAGDWNWCPYHKGTDRQFECTKEITSEMVISEIEKIINQ